MIDSFSYTFCLIFSSRDLILQSIHFIIHQDIGKKLSEIGGRLDHPRLTKELAQEIETLWRDAAVQVASSSKIHMLLPWNLYYWYKVCRLFFLLYHLDLGFHLCCLNDALQLLMSMYTCRKLMPVVISSKFQIVPLISWIICKDYLTQIIFQLRYLKFMLFPYPFHIIWMLCM